MKVKLICSYSDGQDGSHTVRIHRTRQEALERLNRTEEQLKRGNIYDDGAIVETEIEVDEAGKVIKGGSISIE